MARYGYAEQQMNDNMTHNLVKALHIPFIPESLGQRLLALILLVHGIQWAWAQWLSLPELVDTAEK